MTTVQFAFTQPQQVIHNSPARFKFVAAGRRFGKTYLAAMECVLMALATHNIYGDPLDSTSEVVYFGVDREQAKRNVWNLLKEFAKPFMVDKKENDYIITVNNGINDCRIRLLGMDAPDKARGMKIRYVVLDEYADHPADAWGEIIRPALMDCRGSALFIGTPKGKNHAYEMYSFALLHGRAGDNSDPEWEAFNFRSHDNETLNRGELEKIADDYSRGSKALFAQEIEGKFISKSGNLFNEDDFIIDSEEPREGSYYITVDLAGFGRTSGKKNAEIKKLDETAICVCKAYPAKDDNNKPVTKWWVKEIIHGRWGTEETALRILKAYKENKAIDLGIEKGALMNAVWEPLERLAGQKGVWLHITPLSHGNTAKYDRVQWALEGRVKRGMVTLNKGDWNSVLIEQALDFPSKLTHDDLLDALAYQDQIASDWVSMDQFKQPAPWKPLDPIAGY